ncbi:ArnT family glycosyltransferase [Zunongwangia endophytica]|uniref:ArnT family glycosyltransferase n=1 Tax=Zunongwangia endophytica TaxID=1808945 RepID=A0ABV8H5S2_9FLAO|nr:glycosyltransferase family 39 protein [Zunongwangia endophytica]MDN3595067.1 glycosyltransferase family 39 protein [Zunongwangia endophytica]
MKLKFHRYLLALICVCILIFFFNLDAIYINIMEARNFGSAREMLTLDHWLLTTLNDIPRYEKPPLPTWLTAISAKIFGIERLWALRMPAACAATLLTVSLYKFSELINITRKQAFIAALVAVTSFYIIFSGRNGQWDIFTHSFMMVSIYFLFQLFNDDKKLWHNTLLGGIFFGFSILSKGPVSFYTLFLPFVIAYTIVYKLHHSKRKWPALIVFLILGLSVGLWWFAYVRIADPIAFLDIAKDEAANWGNYNTRPFYYYWSFFTQSGIWTIPSFVALLYPYLKNKVSNKKAYQFAILWTLISVILLSIIPEKKSRYLLPVLIPMALNTSFYIEYLFRNYSISKLKEKWIVHFNFGLIAILGITFPIVAPFFLKLSGIYYLWYILTSIALAGIGFGIFYFFKKKKIAKIFYLTISFICITIIFGFPLVDTLINNPNYKAFSELRKLSEKQQFEVYEYKSFSPEIIWNYGEPIPILKDNASFSLPKEKIFGLLIPPNDTITSEMFSKYSIEKVDRYDLNQVNPNKSGYKDRLIRDFYLLKKE